MAGYHTTVAGSAVEALEKLEEEAFALVLSDIQMPGGRGPIC